MFSMSWRRNRGRSGRKEFELSCSCVLWSQMRHRETDAHCMEVVSLVCAKCCVCLGCRMAIPAAQQCLLYFICDTQARWQEIGRAVALPRKSERQRIEAALHAGKPIHTPCKTAYKYEQEELSVRQKGFWILPKARELLERFIPNLSHESDGLILQVHLGGQYCIFS